MRDKGVLVAWQG